MTLLKRSSSWVIDQSQVTILTADFPGKTVCPPGVQKSWTRWRRTVRRRLLYLIHFVVAHSGWSVILWLCPRSCQLARTLSQSHPTSTSGCSVRADKESWPQELESWVNPAKWAGIERAREERRRSPSNQRTTRDRNQVLWWYDADYWIPPASSLIRDYRYERSIHGYLRQQAVNLRGTPYCNSDTRGICLWTKP